MHSLPLISHSNHFARRLIKTSEEMSVKGHEFHLTFDPNSLNGHLKTQDDSLTSYAQYHSIKRDDRYLQFFSRLVRRHVSGDRVIELGCNNGELLKLLGSYDFKNLLGIDPTLHGDQHKDGIQTKKAYWSYKYSRQLEKQWQGSEAIIARHVLEHVPDVNDFVNGINEISSEKTQLFIEVPDFEANLLNADITPIFCEHIHYFTLPGLIALMGQKGWRLKDYYKIEYWGGTLITVFERGMGIPLPGGHEENILKLAKTFQERVENKNQYLKNYLQERRAVLGPGVCAYGVGNRALHLFAFANLKQEIDYFVDSSPEKSGMVIPYYKKAIQYAGEAFFSATPIHTVFITAFGYEAEIFKTIKNTYKLRPEIQIVLMDPNFRFLTIEEI